MCAFTAGWSAVEIRSEAEIWRYTDAKHQETAVTVRPDTMKSILAVLVVVLAAACETPRRELVSDSASDNRVQTASGLIYEITDPVSGPVARRGDTVRIHETLSL